VKVIVFMTALALAACTSDDHLPVGGGGGGGSGGTGGGGGDADGSPSGDGGGDFTGRLCYGVDLRNPLLCPSRDLAGIEVSAAGADTVTTSEGRFALDLPDGVNVVITMTSQDGRARDAIFESDLWAFGDGLTAPVIDTTDWAQLIAAIGGVEPDGTASLVLYVSDQNGPVVGADILPPDGTGQAPYYDDGAADQWNQAGLTGAFGAAVILAVPVVGSTATLTVTIDGEPYTGSVPVRADHLTFARAVLDTSGG